MTKIAYIGAGSLQFGPIIVQDILMSSILSKNGLEKLSNKASGHNFSIFLANSIITFMFRKA